MGEPLISGRWRYKLQGPGLEFPKLLALRVRLAFRKLEEQLTLRSRAQMTGQDMLVHPDICAFNSHV